MIPETRHENHPYNLELIGQIPENTRVLIIGTAPPPRFSLPRNSRLKDDEKVTDFYYGSRDSCFWPTFEKITGQPIKTKEARIQFLKGSEIWVRDVLQTYRRRKDCEHIASDGALIPIRFTIFLDIFTNHHALKVIAFTSQKARNWTRSRLQYEGLLKSSAEMDAGDGHVLLGNDKREVAYHVLPSPSPRAANGTEAIETYRRVFFPRS